MPNQFFVDELKVADDVSTLEDIYLMEEDATAIAAWSFKNKLPSSLPKCVVLHYGYKNMRREYTLCQQIIGSVYCCPNLGMR